MNDDDDEPDEIYLGDTFFLDLNDDAEEYRWLEMSHYKYARTERWETQPTELELFESDSNIVD